MQKNEIEVLKLYYLQRLSAEPENEIKKELQGLIMSME